MRNKIMRFAAVFLSIICLASCGLTATAYSTTNQIPYESYTYWTDISEERKAVYCRPMYEVSQELNALKIGVKNFDTINDVYSDDKNIYILDKSCRIVILDSEYRLVKEIGKIVDANGATYDYSGAQSLYVHSDGTIFISDTDNQRVMRVTADGVLIDIYGLPKSTLIPENFIYKPLKAVMDSHGYLYVLSDGSYYGALLYAPDKSFTGFYGANNVTTGIATAFQNVLKRVFSNNKKQSASVRTLPYSFVDIVIDNNDFIYTATGKTDTYDRVGQVKMLNPGTGNNILDSEEVNFTDDAFNTTFKNGTQLEQDIVGIEVTDNGFVFCIESQFGKVFLYDRSSRMLTAFGGGLGQGKQEGTFVAATAIALNGTDVIVSDKLKNTITIFKPTEYGKKVMGLIDITLDGNYLEAREGWEEVIALDRNFQPAYSGLARAYLAENDYENAMEWAQEGYDRETYQLAFEFYRKGILEDYFWLIALVVVVLVGGIIALRIFFKKKNITIIKNKQVKLMLKTLIHPALTFEEIKEKKQGSVTISLVLIALFYVTAVIQVICGGFMFTQYDPATFNSLWVFVRSAGLVVIWILSNWMISTLMQGKGTMREICIVTCYSLTPIIIERFLRLLFTNILIPTEAMFLTGMDALAIGYAAILLIIGLIKIHDYSMSRLVGTSVLSIAWLAILVFLMIFVGMLVQQIGGFAVTVFLELIS
ncbi:MAG: hypothetical protein E7562_04220 [Ruminococcaceae bacterium]|nr:hypothetical protein [Oscillospiraceae bacterium]